MPRNKAPVCDLGAIYAHGGEFRAHIKFRAADGQYKNIYGPSRATEDEAQEEVSEQPVKPKPDGSNVLLNIKDKYHKWPQQETPNRNL